MTSSFNRVSSIDDNIHESIHKDKYIYKARFENCSQVRAQTK